MSDDYLILSESEYEHLLEEVHELQARITELTALRDDLVYHVCPALRAEYDEKVVSLERELIAANMYLREKQRIIEILQAQLNQQQEPSYEKAETKAKEEFREYEEELKRKAEEAKRQREKWEKENQWSAHDKAEKEAKTREKAYRAGEKDNVSEEADDENDPDRKIGKDKQRNKENSDKEKGKSKENAKENTGEKARDEKDRDTAAGRGGAGNDNDSHGTGGPGDTEDHSRETPGQKLKRLYRKIVKRLHPDMHPDPTEREKELFNRAAAAYEKGNLEEMERIWEELSDMDAPEDMFEDTSEGRKKLREFIEKLKMRVHLLTMEIDRIKSDFPYRIKAFLEDEEAVAEFRRGMQSKIDKVREMDRQLAEYIEELKEKLRKRKKPDEK